MFPSVYIVILAWNSDDDIVECLDSVYHLDYPNFKVLVVDNGSTDNTLVRVRGQFPQVHTLENSRNLGFAAGNNVGIRYALTEEADYIFLLNDDTIVLPDTVSILVRHAEQDKSVGMLGPSVVSYFDHSNEFLGAVVNWQRGLTFQIQYSPDGVGVADHVAGCALFVKADVARQIGLLDANYFCYFEDTDWGVRCARAGYRVVTVFSSKVYHKGTPDNMQHTSPALLYYYRRNQCLFMRKHATRRIRFLFYIRYANQCLVQFYYLAKEQDSDRANAVLDGYWAGITGHYGESRAQAPIWFKRVIYFSKGYLFWLATRVSKPALPAVPVQHAG